MITYRISKITEATVRMSTFTNENHVAEIKATSNEDYSKVHLKVTTLAGNNFAFGYTIEEDVDALHEKRWLPDSKNKETLKNLCDALKEENEWLNKAGIIHSIYPTVYDSDFTDEELYIPIIIAAMHTVEYFDYDKEERMPNERHEVICKLMFNYYNDPIVVKDNQQLHL